MPKPLFELLKGVELFASLDEAQVALISQVAERRTYGKGECIIREDDDGAAGFFIIAEGELEVYITADDNKDTILSLLGQGDFFGEMSLIDNEPRSASVKSTGPAVVYQIRRTNFLNQLKKFPDLSMSLLVELSKKLRKANRQIGSLATLSVYGRIAGTLVNLAEERGRRINGDHGNKIILIQNRPTQQQLADMSGTTRETVSRILTNLKSKGAISINGKDLFILCEDVLRHREED